MDDNNQITGNIDPSTVDLILKDAQGNNLENETNVQEGDGSWSIDSERLEAIGDYEFFIEGENDGIRYNDKLTKTNKKMTVNIFLCIIYIKLDYFIMRAI